MSKYFTPLPDPSFDTSDVLLDYAEFSGLSIEEISVLIQNAKRNSATEYHVLGDTFYTDAETYVIEVMSGNTSTDVRANLLNKFIPNIIQLMEEHPGSTFVDFGGGTGRCVVLWHDVAINKSPMRIFHRG